MDDFDLEIKKEFINEALINLEEAEGSFMELESSPDPKPLLDKIFRLAHNLKGGSRAVGFGQVAEFTHQLENLVLKIQKNEVALSPEVVTTLLRSNDRLIEMLSELKSNLAAEFKNEDLLSEIQNWLEGKAAPAAVSIPSAAPTPTAAPEVVLQTVTTPNLEAVPAPPEVAAAPESMTSSEPPQAPSADAFFAEEEPIVEAPTPTQSEPQTPAPAPPAAAVAKPATDTAKTAKTQETKGGEDEVIRVNLSRIDLLNDYVGELIVLQSVVQQQSLAANSTTLQASIRQMVKLSKNIQELTMGLRMLPVKPLIQKLQRVVRDTAKALNKSVNFEVIGEQLEVDKSVLDRLADPLIHILRNAVDHGLESTNDRTATGKPSSGTVILSFSNEGNHLVVEVKDDGKGINSEIIRKKAIEKRLITESQQLTEKQLVHLVFHPGFSTKTETSEISGRGVGMDVVKTNVEKIGGHVDIFTVVGKGSTFRMQIPLSLAVFDGLVVTSEMHRYVVPISQVQETINLKTQKVYPDKLGIGSCFELRGTVVPLFHLDEALDARKKSTKLDGTALIIDVEDRPMGLVVNDILRSQQIVIKPFSNGIAPQKGWIGNCVLGDGQPTLILSPIELLNGRISYGESA